MFELSSEYNASLPDTRLVDRCQLIGSRLAQAPEASFPSLFPLRRELKATYRFINSQRFDEQDIHTGHSDMTAQRAHQSETVLAIHDTTEYRFPIHDENIIRQNLAKFSRDHQGFLGHHTLILQANGTREPLGHLRFQPFIHKKDVRDEQMQEFWNSKGGLFENERHRWLEAVSDTEQQLDGTKVIHVMDSESDFYQMLAQLTEQGSQFVLRQAKNRKCVDGSLSREGWDGQELLATREITLSKRTSKGKPQHKQEHPPRKKRPAKLSIRARQLELQKPKDVPKGVEKEEWKEVRESVVVNVVQVKELNPPEEEVAVEWLLFTSEPVETEEDVLFVVDCYLARWLVEEFFKALKTGCGYSKRQEESASSLLKVLALSLPVAWFLLELRAMSTLEPQREATELLEDWELSLLKSQTPEYKWGRRAATVKDVLGALAHMGGHHRPKKAVGWMVLGRGYQRFLEQKKGAEAMLKLLGKMDA